MEDLLNPEPDTGVAAEETAPAAESGPTLESVTAERDRLQAERDELWDRFLRKQAEFENFRRRTLREKEEIRDFAAMETLRPLLAVLDDFERALKAPAADDEYRKGIELIYKRLFDALMQMGLTPIEAVNRKFDPNLHQAVESVKVEEGEDHIILEEFARGYEYKGRLLRPAMVKVAVRE